jgi:hypothetical protein
VSLVHAWRRYHARALKLLLAPLPSTQTAWCHLRRGTPAEALELVHDAPVPGLDGLKDDEVLVKVHAAALNPVYAQACPHSENRS